MLIGDRIRALREAKNLSQGDIEKRSGLLRCYLSSVENGHTVPSIETLERLARALAVPIYQLLYEGEEPPRSPHGPSRRTTPAIVWGTSREEIHFWNKLRGFLARMKESDRQLLLRMTLRMARR